MQLRKTISVLTAALTLLAGGAIVSGSAYADDNTPAVVSAKAAGEVLAQYNFDDGSLNDSSGNNAVALQTFSGAKIENYNDINSKALSVRGAKQYAESIGSPFASVTDGISFSFRAKTRNVSAGDVGVIVGTDSNKYLVIRLQGTKVTLAATASGAAGESGAQVSKEHTTADWTYYIAVFNNGKLTLYINGEEAGSIDTLLKASDFGDASAFKFRIGKSFVDTDGSIDGGFDDIKFYDGGLPVSSHDIAVDLNQTTGAVKYGATGFLYGLADDGVPTDTMLQGLSHLHTQVGRPTDGLQHPNGDSVETANQWFRNGGQDIQIYLKDMYPIPWPYPAYSPSIEEDYLPKIKKQMNTAKDAGLDTSKVILITFNEPDIGDKNYRGSANPSSDGFKRLLADWDTMYKFIKDYNAQNGTQFQVGGPNYNAYHADAYEEFLKHTKNAGTVPDVVTWHELNGAEAQGFLPHYNSWKNIEKAVLGETSNIPISINEYANRGTQQVTPGVMVQYISHFENTKVSAALPYWFPAGDLDWLVTRNNQATSTWWLYNWYGQLSGNTVKVTLKDPNQNTQAVASYDETTQQTRILFGGAEPSAISLANTLKVSGADAKYEASAVFVG